LSVALRAQGSLDVFGTVAESYNTGGETLSALAIAVRAIEEWARANAGRITGTMPDAAKLDAVRDGWLGGLGLQALSALDGDAKTISKDFYGYQLPWIIHAASQVLRGAGESERADALGNIALLVELGLSTENAARIFLAGVRSRAAATELAGLGVSFGSSVSEISRKLRTSTMADELRPHVSPATRDWLDLMVGDAIRRGHNPVPQFAEFTLRDAGEVDVLHARELDGRFFLCSADGRKRITVEPDRDLPFDKVVNDLRVAFRRSYGSTWRLDVRDPRVEMSE